MSSNQNVLKNAIIRNSRLCRESENYAQYFVFDTERDLKGWNFVEQGTLFGVSGGFYFLTAQGQSPSLSRSDSFGFVDSSLYTEIVIRYKYVKNRKDSVADTGKIQFLTASALGFDDLKSVTFPVNSDGDWHVYKINMGPVPTWVGNITNLKIFFATNGQTGDDVLISFIKIQQPNFLFCTDSCYEDTSITVVGKNFDIEQLNNPPQNFSISDSSLLKTALVVRDPINFSNKVLKLSNTSGLTSGPKATLSTEPSAVSGFFSLRFFVSATGATIKLKSSVLLNQDTLSLKVDSDGRLKYKNGLSFIDLNDISPVIANSWHDLLITFDGDTLLNDVSLNGQLVGKSLPYLSSGQVIGIELGNSSLSINDAYFDDVILVSQTEVNKLCPGIGRQGEATGEEVLFSKLDILEGINDTLIVNLNAYGDVIVKLDPRFGLDSVELRDILEEKLSDLDVGGYPYSEVSFFNNRFIFRSGTYGFDSTVVIKKHNTSSLSDDLGFTSGSTALYTSQVGRPHSTSFKFTNNYRAKTIDLLTLKSNINNEFNLLQDPTDYSVEGGSRAAGEQGRKNQISGKNKTIIDFYHRASEEGLLSKVYFHGVLPKAIGTRLSGGSGQVVNNLFNTGFTKISQYGVSSGDLLIINTSGYSSNGTYLITVDSDNGGLLRVTGNKTLAPGTNLVYSIQSYSKLKHFRPRLDGTLDLINEVQLGERISGQVYTRSPDSFSASINWYVHRGDLFGIYNADSIYVGNDANGNPDSLYLEEENDLIGTGIKVGQPKGQGVKGIGIYLNSKDYQTKASYDIVFDTPTIIKNVEILGSQKTEKRYYNLGAAVGNGFSVSATITGTHKHLLDTGNGPTSEYHNNIGYNLTALTDGLQFASNGSIVQFEQNSTNASYFYVSGDGEFAGYIINDSGVIEENSLEYPISPDGNGGFNGDQNVLISDYKADAFDLRFSWNVPKTIDRFKIYFKEFPNAKAYFLEWLKDGSGTFDGDLPGYEKIGKGNSSEFSKVLLNGLLIDDTIASSDTNSAFYQHLLPIFNLSPEVLNTSGKNLYFTLYYPYTLVDKYFDPVRTTSLIWKCLYHESTKISEIEVFSSSQSPSTLESAVEFYFSSDGEFFQRVEPEILFDGSLRFDIGFPVKAARLVIEPESSTTLDRIKFNPVDDFIKYQDSVDNTVITSVDLNIVRGDFSAPEHIIVTNLTGQSADVEISIATDELYDTLLVKSSLESVDSIYSPEIGPPGQIFLDEDYELAVTQNVAINADCYGLKNLAIGKKFYLNKTNISPSDYMVAGADLTKWFPSNSTFPKSPPKGMERVSISGLGMKMFDINYGGPKDTIQHLDTLTSIWNVTGSFSSSIACQYDLAGGSANGAGSRMGIIDGSGRKIYIEKKRVRYSAGATNRNRDWSEYNIDDSLLGNLHHNLNYCKTPARCGSTFGSIDDNAEYLLTITRVLSPGYDVLRVSYIDSLNGTGSGQFGNDSFIEINLRTLSTPLIGQLKLFIQNFWADDSGNGITSDSLTSPFNYVKINRFLFGGESSYETSYDFESGYKTVGVSGSVLEDNRTNNLDVTTKMVAIDLEGRFSLDVFKTWTPSGATLWNYLSVQFSNSEVSNPDLVNWGNSDVFDVRWILFTQPAIPYLSTSGLKYLDHLRIYPEITALAPQQTFNSEWEYLGKILTDGDYSSQIKNIDYPVVVVKFPNHFSLANFKALDSSGRESPTNDSYSTYKGWFGHSDYTLSDSNTDNPTLPVWDNWIDYNNVNKNMRDIKWIALRCKEFNLSSPRHIAEIVAPTVGIRGDAIGEVKDKVDFTEYAEWYNIKYQFDKNIALLAEGDFASEGILYGSSNARQSLRGQLSPTLAAFDGSDSAGIYLTNLPSNVWRVFGDITVTSGVNDSTFSGTTSGTTPIVISGSTFTQTLTYRAELLSGFSFNVGADTKSIPNTIAIERLIGIDPTLDASWSAITTETNLATQLVIDNNLSATEYQFNGGQPFTYKFSPPVTTSGLRLSITNCVEQSNTDRTINLSEFKVFTSINETVSPAVTITNDPLNKVGGRRSLRIDYLAGNAQPVKVTVSAAFRVGPDVLWSLQDYLKFQAQGSPLFDFENSYIRFGTDSDHYYEWNLSTLSGSINPSTFSKIALRFKGATMVNKVGFNFDNDTAVDLLTPLNLTEQEFTFLQFEFKPIGTAAENLTIWFDNFDIERETFGIPALNSTTSLYLNNSELIYFPLSDFDIRKGFFEAVIIPDWSMEGILDPRHERVFTIFSALNSLNESFSCYYSERYGLVLIAYSYVTQERHRFHCGHVPGLTRYKPIKLSIAWDSLGTSIEAAAGVTLRVWTNDTVLKDFMEPWNIDRTKDCYFFLGSRAYQNDVAISGTSDYPKYINDIILVPETKSLTGGVQNLILSKEPRKVYFEEIQFLKDKIYLSINGITYYNGISSVLPITIYNVDPGESIDLWLKVNLPNNLKNLARTGYLRTRWRLSE